MKPIDIIIISVVVVLVILVFVYLAKRKNKGCCSGCQGCKYNGTCDKKNNWV